MKPAPSADDLRRVIDHPATRCLLACLLTAAAGRVRKQQVPPRTSARNGTCSS